MNRTRRQQGFYHHTYGLIERQKPEQLLKDLPDCADYIAYSAPYTFMQQWAALNLAAEWKKIDAPTLVVYGTSDYISTIVDDPYHRLTVFESSRY